MTLYEIVAETPMRAQDSSLYGVLINPVCKAPCDTHIAPTLGRSFLLATGIDTRWTASRRMTLPEDSEAIYIRVHPGNKALRIAGAVLIAVGSATVVAGSLWAFPKDTRVAGLATMGVGALPVVAGIPMTLLGRTRWRFAAAPH